MPKKKSTKSTNPEIEIKAKFGGDEKKWKEWMSECKSTKSTSASHGTAGALYCVGFIGSMVYWWQTATDFGSYITALLKSLVWPAYIVYKLLESFYGAVS